ncbi:MAG: HAD hydrolase family protein [Pseudomonadota bacterium]
MSKLDKALKDIALVGFDVDGVFTDGRFYLNDNGVESKAFHTQDGYGIRRLLDEGIEVAIISGRQSAAVYGRMQELGVKHVFQGCKDKVAAFSGLADELKVGAEATLYVGDDVPDLPLLKHVAVGVAVNNAVDAVKANCMWVTKAHGGFGAVREVCDRLLDAKS